ncbi:cold-shock protein [Paenibacillus pinihumi]|uniref:cold-shock protein n=1 Tax=Paenibacillus pinihumi TaxID=669462 RepID=UPI000492176F|nr:cold-shock protein [Paenibacillus pinihumi]
MYYSRKKPVGDYEQEMTAIWSCTQESCNGWMRDDFSFEVVPTCSQCNSPMLRSMKSLPVLINSSYGNKMGIKKMETKL